MSALPPHEIEWIGRLRSEGNTWKYIAEEWGTSRVRLMQRIKASGANPNMLGIPDMPVISRRALHDNPGSIEGPNIMTVRGHEPVVVMPLREYTRLKGLEAKGNG